MLIVGELINSSRKKIAAAIKEENVAYLQEVARTQHENGADYIDVNAGVFEDKESELLVWLVKLVQDVVDGPCCLDSPNPRAIEAALKVHRGAPMLNSISLERDRFDAMLPIVTGSECKIISLCMGEDGMPSSVAERVDNAKRLVDKLVGHDVKPDNIYIDALAQPVSTTESHGMEFLNAVERIMGEIEGVHTICGLSNVSFGLPKRKVLNQVFAAMAVTKGLDAAILNPNDAELMKNILVAETLAGRDEYCSAYIDAYRDGLLG